MNEQMILAASAFMGLLVIAAVSLSAWRDWLALKSRELEMRRPNIENGSPEGAARIEIADLKERVRQLEAIANGVEL